MLHDRTSVVAVLLAAVAVILASVSLGIAAGSHPPAGFPLVCSGPRFTSPRLGSVGTYEPCSTTPPWRRAP